MVSCLDYWKSLIKRTLPPPSLADSRSLHCYVIRIQMIRLSAKSLPSTRRIVTSTTALQENGLQGYEFVLRRWLITVSTQTQWHNASYQEFGVLEIIGTRAYL